MYKEFIAAIITMAPILLILWLVSIGNYRRRHISSRHIVVDRFCIQTFFVI